MYGIFREEDNIDHGLAKYPRIFESSLKKTIFPRRVVVQCLVSKGQIEKQISLDSLVKTSEKSFLKKFVSMYEVEEPEVLKVYQT